MNSFTPLGLFFILFAKLHTKKLIPKPCLLSGYISDQCQLGTMFIETSAEQNCRSQHRDPFYEADVWNAFCPPFALPPSHLELQRKFCHCLAKSIVLEQSATIAYYSFSHWRNEMHMVHGKMLHKAT